MSSFQENFETKGYWWFPENPDRKIAGTLKYSTSDIQLQLMGTLTDLNKFQKQFSYDIIVGVSIKGEPITLYKCYAKQFSMSSPLFAQSSYGILNVFKGFQYSKKEDIKFNKVYSRLTHFDEWMGIDGFNINLEKFKENEISITFSQPKEIKFKLDEQFSLSIWFGYSINSVSVDEKERSIKQQITLSIETKNEQVQILP